MKKYQLLLIVLLFISIQGINYSIPRFALRMGAQCADCHVNPTGGQLRNDGGFKVGKNVLPMFSAHEEFKADNKIGENIYFGLDYRTQYLYSQEFGKSDFQKMTGSVYTGVNVTDKLDIYGRYDFIFQIWEAYAVGHFLPNNSYIKAGTFLPNFGIRIDDHTAYTRGGDLGVLFATGISQGLIYEPRYTETGVELGIYLSDFAFLTASVGNPHERQFETDPSYTASLQLTPTIANSVALLIGGSYSTFKGILAPLARTSYPKVNMFGGFLGIGIDDFTLLGEYDIADDYLVQNSSSSALMVEAAYQIVKGLEAVVRYDRFDPNTEIDKDDLSRYVIGLDFYPYSFIEILPQYRIQMENPDVDNDSFVLQFHFYY